MSTNAVMTRDRHLIDQKQAQLAKRQKSGSPLDKMQSELNALIEQPETLYQAAFVSPAKNHQ